jgi:c-di-GMP-binding flagellar brake protein YcgR
MLQMIRVLESNLRTFVRNLRQAPRYSPQLRFTLTMLDQYERGEKRRTAVVLSGFTRNLSETGIALAVPAIRKGDHHLAATNRRLLIVLELPTGPIRLQAAPVRYQRLSRSESGYLIGVRIVAVSEQDKLRFQKYLHRLSRGARMSSRQRESN